MKKTAVSRALAVLVVALCALSPAATSPNFLHRNLLAGRVSLLNGSFVVERLLGTANFSPELRLPVQLEYDSSRREGGLFGFAWRSPQLESFLTVAERQLEWQAPWGERIVLPRTDNLPEGLTVSAAYTPWRLEAGSDFAAGRVAIRGVGRHDGWRFEYRSGRLSRVASPEGATLEFAYEGGALRSVSRNGRAFVEVTAQDGLAREVAVNGVQHFFSYDEKGRLAAVRTASLEPEHFSYDDAGFLCETARGEDVERFTVEPGTGRLLADRLHEYRYPEARGGRDERRVEITRLDGATAFHILDRTLGRHSFTDFAGLTRTFYYDLRPEAASLGQVRKILDKDGQLLTGIQYDPATGLPAQVTDRLGTVTELAYDAHFGLASVARRTAGEAESHVVLRLRNDENGRPLEAIRLDGDGRELSSRLTAEYDAQGRPVRLSDGRGETTLRYNAFGYPVTHYHELVAQAQHLSALSLHCMKTKEFKDQVIFLHEVIEGSVDRSYGIHVAKLAGLPPMVTKRADQILRIIERDNAYKDSISRIDELPLFNYQDMQVKIPDYSVVVETLRQINPDDLTAREALQKLYELKELLDEK